MLLNSIASGLTAPTDSVAGIATATLAPAASYQIGQAFKKTDQECSLKHILAHTILGAVVAKSGSNNTLAGALSAGGAEALAPRVAEYLYGKKGSELNAEQKETVSSIVSLAGAGVGAAVGNSSANTTQGSLNAENVVENNLLTNNLGAAKLNNPIEQSLHRKLKQAGIETSDKYQDMFNKCQNQICRDNVQKAFLRADEESSREILELYKSGKLTEQEVDVLISNYANKMLDGVQESERKNSGKNDIYSQSGMTWTPAGIGGNPYISEIITRNVITKLYQKGVSPETISSRLEQYQASSKWFNSIETSSQAALLAQATGMTAQAIITVLTRGKGGKAVANTTHIEKVVAQERNLNLGKQNPRFNEELNRRITNSIFKDLSQIPRNLQSTLNISHIRSTLLENGLISKRGRENGFSIAVATVKVDGVQHNYLSLSGSSWKGEKIPESININNINYKIINNSADERILGKRTRTHSNGQVENNLKHAEMKLGSYLEQTFFTSKKKVDIHMAIQNTNPNSSGICIWGCQKTIPQLGTKNPNMNINLYHGHDRLGVKK